MELHVVGIERHSRDDVNAQGRVIFHGRQAAIEIAKLHRQCTLFVLPSLMDNSPNALVEAMASGMPCVASDAGGIPSLLRHGETGWIVPAGDAMALAEAILRLLADRDLMCRLGAAANAEVQNNRPSVVAEETVRIYRSIVAGEPTV